MVLVQKWPFSQLLFLGKIQQENVFYDILEPKNAFLGYKNKKFKKSKNWRFSKGLNYGFGNGKWLIVFVGRQTFLNSLIITIIYVPRWNSLWNCGKNLTFYVAVLRGATLVQTNQKAGYRSRGTNRPISVQQEVTWPVNQISAVN